MFASPRSRAFMHTLCIARYRIIPATRSPSEPGIGPDGKSQLAWFALPFPTGRWPSMNKTPSAYPNDAHQSRTDQVDPALSRPALTDVVDHARNHQGGGTTGEEGGKDDIDILKFMKVDVLALTLRDHPVTFLCSSLKSRRIITSAEATAARDRRWVEVAGLVLVRQPPGSAKGVMFITIEDETGVANHRQEGVHIRQMMRHCPPIRTGRSDCGRLSCSAARSRSASFQGRPP